MADRHFAIVVGAGPAGIAMACQLKKYGVHDFVMVDRNTNAGGTWFANSYPGCECDVPSLLYSFSFAPKRDWLRPMADRGEILAYFDSVMSRFGVHRHVKYQRECVRAMWSDKTSLWRVELKDLSTGHIAVEEAPLFVAATGLFSRPQYPKIEGLNGFKGQLWHSGEWKSHHDVRGKRVAVIGSGPSAMQLIPHVAAQAGHLSHYSRQKRWMFQDVCTNVFDPTKAMTEELERRTSLIAACKDAFELDYLEHLDGVLPRWIRRHHQETSQAYMNKNAPAQYYEPLVPSHPYGCKRRVVDTGYLDCLKAGAELVTADISRIDESGIVTPDGRHEQFDCIILATGFSTLDYLAPIEVYGLDETRSLREYWNQAGGPRAYNSVSVSGFPNMAILFGPNGAPAHHSALFNIEVQVDYVVKVYVQTLLQGEYSCINVDRAAEEQQANALQHKFGNTEHAQACSGSLGVDLNKNCVSFPGLSVAFWKQLKGNGMRGYVLR